MALISRAAHGLRPNPTEAVSHLIDAAELFIQLSASVCLCTLARGTLGSDASDLAEWCDAEYLAKPLSIGHFAEIWSRSATLLLTMQREEDRPFLPIATYVQRDKRASRDKKAILEDFVKLPALRNRKKGHSFTLPPGDAAALIADWEPRFQAIIGAADFWTSRLRLCLVREVAGRLAELVVLHGVAPLHTAPAIVREMAEPLVRDEIVVVPIELLDGTAQPSAGDCVSLTPIVKYEDERLFFFQGKRGKLATYLSSDAKELEREGLLPLLRVRLTPLLAAIAAPPTEPAWAASLTDHEFLCEATLIRRRENAEGFYKGSPASWNDLDSQLDVPREFSGPKGESTTTQSLVDMLEDASQRATRFECPVIVLLGHAGSGKTTSLLRVGHDLWRRLGSRICVLRRKLGAPLSLSDYITAARDAGSEVICVLADEAGEIHRDLRTLRYNAMHEQIPLMIVCAERENLWPGDLGDPFRIQTLSDAAIAALLERLDARGMLGQLAGIDPLKRAEVLRSRLDRQLLVALREATEGRRFDEILRDECERIPSEDARRVYSAVCLLHEQNVFLPVASAKALTQATTKADEYRLIVKPCQGVLVARSTGNIRVYGARHQLIAAVVCDETLSDPQILDQSIASTIWALAAGGDLLLAIEHVVRLLSGSRVTEALRAGAILDGTLEATRTLDTRRGQLIGRLIDMHASFWLALYRDCNRSQLSFCSEASHLRAAALMQRTEGLAQALEVCENGVALLREKSWPAVKLLLRYTELLQAAEKHERAIKACEEAVAEAESYDIQSQRAYYKLSVMYEGEGRNAEAKAMCFKGVARRGDDGDHDDAIYFRASDLFERDGQVDLAISVIRSGISEADRRGAGCEQLVERLVRLLARKSDWGLAADALASRPERERVQLFIVLGRFCTLDGDGLLHVPSALREFLEARGLWPLWPAMSAGALLAASDQSSITQEQVAGALAKAEADASCNELSLARLRGVTSRLGE